MSFNPIEFNQVIGQSSEVAKTKKKELDKKRLEEIEKEKLHSADADPEEIKTVFNKDPEVGLEKNTIDDQELKPHEKKPLEKELRIEKIRENFKGNFLDIKE